MSLYLIYLKNFKYYFPQNNPDVVINALKVNQKVLSKSKTFVGKIEYSIRNEFSNLRKTIKDSPKNFELKKLIYNNI